MTNRNLTFIEKIIRFCLENKLVVFILAFFLIFWGILVAPFDWKLGMLPRDPVAVDAIPDIGENQQIVFTKWPGRSPKDIEDQITYPLTVSLLGIPGVKTVRSYSYFGFSSIYVIFKENVEFYWSRSRMLEKLASLSPGLLPENTSPVLGPDATALGQVFWYTLEGKDAAGNPTGGWDLDELRSIQDFNVRYALMGAEGISEVSSIGGFVKEYQVDIDPNAMKIAGIQLSDVIAAVKNSNIDIGARTIEVNSVEYVIRGLGFIQSKQDIENTVIKSSSGDQVPIYIKNIANVQFGPALRRGALDKGGAEVVGGVAVVRFGENPLATIASLKKKIREISPGLPEKVLPDGTRSKVTIVPFYDRTKLIGETLKTLNSALLEEILITIVVVIVMVMHLASSLIIAGLLPIAILICFILMKLFNVDANIVALSGIAIAIGTMVDMGIVLCENILKHVELKSDNESYVDTIFKAASEVSGAVIAASLTTIVSFLPVFGMQASEGKLFKPLAYTKSFALISALIVAITIIPPVAEIIFRKLSDRDKANKVGHLSLIALGLIFIPFLHFLGAILVSIGFFKIFRSQITPYFVKYRFKFMYSVPVTVILLTLIYYLADSWLPLGIRAGLILNILFCGLIISLILYGFKKAELAYPKVLNWCLENKGKFILFPSTLLLGGFLSWSNLGEEFMPPLDEGSFLYMPTTMPHASIGEALDQLSKLDVAISNIPEIKSVVGKLGRADSPLDPAPISMFEIIINYKSEYLQDPKGRVQKFRYNSSLEQFERDANNQLIPDSFGRPFKQWRDAIHSPDDIWKEITKATKLIGVTGAPKLQPIAARIVMLQSGFRAPMGVKIKGPTLEAVEKVGFQIEQLLKQVPSVEASTVIADRIVGKPYLEIQLNRKALARYGLSINAVQSILEVAIGGKPLTLTIEGRERYAVRIRYPYELRNDIESIKNILIPTPIGQQIPLGALSEIKFSKRPQVIKSEDTALIGYVVFDKKSDLAEVPVVQEAQKYLESKIADGTLILPPGVSYSFAGNYENQLRSKQRMLVILPLTLLLIFLILYLQSRSVSTTLLVFSSIFVAWSGGFIMLWLFGQSWFFNTSFLGFNLQDLFNIQPHNLSIAVWVGFIALFGIASDDGVLISAYLQQIFRRENPDSIQAIREATIEAGKKRIRPALMTTATTILALLPVLTSSGRGADIMIPMAIPTFGGMCFALITVLIVPVVYCWIKERELTNNS